MTSLNTRIAILVDRLLDLLPGDRNDPASLEARVRKATDRQAAVIVRAAEHADAIQEVAEQKARGQVEAAISTAYALANRLDALAKAGLIDQDRRFQQAMIGLSAAGFHPEATVEFQ